MSAMVVTIIIIPLKGNQLSGYIELLTVSLPAFDHSSCMAVSPALRGQIFSVLFSLF